MIKARVVKTEINVKKFEEAEKKYRKQVKQKAFNWLGNASTKGFETVIRFTPPLFKGEDEKRSIDAKHYKRPIYDIAKLLNEKRSDLTEKEKKLQKRYYGTLIKKFNEGYRFFTIHDVYKRKKWWFDTTERKLKNKYGRIKYRGFMRVMYGLQLTNKGFESPIIRSLLSKSPDLKNLKEYNVFRYQQNDNQMRMYNVNRTLRRDLSEIHKKKFEKKMESILKGYINKHGK